MRGVIDARSWCRHTVLRASQTKSVVNPPSLGHDWANTEGLGIFLNKYGEYYMDTVRIGGSGAGNASIPTRCFIHGAYLDLIRMDRSQSCPLEDGEPFANGAEKRDWILRGNVESSGGLPCGERSGSDDA